MRSKSYAIALLSLFVAFTGSALAAEEKPTLLDSFREWHVYSVGAGADRLCYALSQPKQMNPANVTRDAVFFLISTWPGRKVRGEPSVVPGYQYKVGTKVQVQIGSDKFDLFTKNDGSAGGAWLENPADEKKLVDAMKRGSEMSITGTSSRGTLTRDNYSLAGISAALDKIDATCK
ncbi:MAG TPA: invasion associated locus B family protein [Micropepsaceae bacterium]|nr:invasion associated locus B family protein [Micropepsaceae bacterium]